MRRRELISAAVVPIALAGCLQLESNAEEGDGADAGSQADGGGNGSGDGSTDGGEESSEEAGGDGGSDDGGSGEGGSDGEPSGDGDGSEEDSTDDGETGDELPDVAIRHERSLPPSTMDETYISAVPEIRASPSMPVDDRTAFVIENDDTGDSVTVSVTDDRSVDAERVSLFVYGPQGFVESRSASISVSTADSFHDLDVTVEGDGTTFTERVRASYRVAYEVGGERVAETGPKVVPVGHRTEFEYTVGEETVEYGFAAGELPTDDLRARLFDRTDSTRVSDVEARYDEAADRLVASADAEAVDEGEYSAAIEVYNPDGYVELDLFADLTVE